MSKETSTSPEANAGRNFHEMMRQESSSVKRAESLRVGDCIDIDSSRFKTWTGLILAGDVKSLDGFIKLTVKSITYRDDEKRAPDKIIVSGGGVEKEVDASLFYNYNRPPNSGHGEMVGTEMTSSDISWSDPGLDNGAG